jgi:hypothetical protein
MLESQFRKEDTLLTPIIRFSYSDIRLISETPLYHLYEGKSRRPPCSIHTIRTFDNNSKFAIQDYDTAASLFIKELLHLIAIESNCVLVNTFEISDGGKKMAFASLPYTPLSSQIQQDQNLKITEDKKRSKSEFNDIKCLKDIITDILFDVEFLSKELGIRDCSSILRPHSIYRFNESGAYFLGDWLTAVMSEVSPNQIVTTLSVLPSLPKIFKEMHSLGLSILELNGIDPEKVKKLREMETKEDVMSDTFLKNLIVDEGLHISEELKNLLERMLDINLNFRPKFDEFKTHKSARRKIQPKNSDELEINLELSGHEYSKIILKLV